MPPMFAPVGSLKSAPHLEQEEQTERDSGERDRGRRRPFLLFKHKIKTHRRLHIFLEEIQPCIESLGS